MTSTLDTAGGEGTGEGRVVAAGLEAGVAGARDATEGFPEGLAEEEFEKALTRPAAVFEARLPTDEDTLDAMDALAAAGR